MHETGELKKEKELSDAAEPKLSSLSPRCNSPVSYTPYNPAFLLLNRLQA